MLGDKQNKQKIAPPNLGLSRIKAWKRAQMIIERWLVQITREQFGAIAMRKNMHTSFPPLFVLLLKSFTPLEGRDKAQ